MVPPSIRRIWLSTWLWLSSCGGAPATTPPTLPVSLAPAEHAYGLAVDRIGRFPIAEGEALRPWVDRHCGPEAAAGPPAPPPDEVAPMVVRVLGGQVQWGRTPPVSAVSDDVAHGLLIPELMERAWEARSARRALLKACAQGVSGLGEPIVLLVLDRDVSADVWTRVIWTLGQAGFASFAQLVDDPSPEGSRAGAALGGTVLESGTAVHGDGVVLSGTMALDAGALRWYRDGGETMGVSLSPTGVLPRFLGETGPPKVRLGSHGASPVESLLRGQDRLAGAGIYCVETQRQVAPHIRARAPHGAPAARPGRAPFVLPASGVVSVHLMELPGWGPQVQERSDGARCSTGVWIPAPGAVGSVQLVDGQLVYHEPAEARAEEERDSGL